MKIFPDNPLLTDLRSEDVAAYLRSMSDWEQLRQDNHDWYVFRSNHGVNKSELRLVLPRDSDLEDTSVYLANAVNLLSALADYDPERIIEQIDKLSKDVLKIRNIETGVESSIPLPLAARQVGNFKQLVLFSACSEEEPKAYYARIPSTSKRILKRINFAHTFRGSFGFTLEAKLSNASRYVEDPETTSEDKDEVFTDPPVERRILERIMRGLVAAQNATSQLDISNIVQQYRDGFNANMCNAVIDISRENKNARFRAIEYSVVWSPKLAPSQDLISVGAIQLNETNYRLLSDAAREMVNLEPEYETVEGLVTTLKSLDDPQADIASNRSVIIKWQAPWGRANVLVVLERDDYNSAIEAHRNWKVVQVKGILRKRGNGWLLDDPTNFAVVR